MSSRPAELEEGGYAGVDDAVVNAVAGAPGGQDLLIRQALELVGYGLLTHVQFGGEVSSTFVPIATFPGWLLAFATLNTFAGIAPGLGAACNVAQIIGVAVGVKLLLVLCPGVEPVADEVVVAHDSTDAAAPAGPRMTEHLTGDQVAVRSAGSAPGKTINPAAVEAIAEVGIDITDQTQEARTGNRRDRRRDHHHGLR